MNVTGIAEAISEKQLDFPIFGYVFTNSVISSPGEYLFPVSGARLAMESGGGNAVVTTTPILYDMSASVDYPIDSSVEDASSDLSSAIRRAISSDIIRLCVNYCQATGRIIDSFDAFAQYPINDKPTLDYIESIGIVDSVSGLAFGQDEESRGLTFYGDIQVTQDVALLKDAKVKLDATCSIVLEIFPDSEINLIRTG